MGAVEKLKGALIDPGYVRLFLYMDYKPPVLQTPHYLTTLQGVHKGLALRASGRGDCDFRV